MERNIGIALAAALALCCGGAHGETDGFSAVQCGSDIAGPLVGKTMPNERVVAIESRHKDLGLHDLGGTEISDDVFLASWKICGEEFELLEKQDVVRDVLKAPPHSRSSPLFIGTCTREAAPVSGTIVAVLNDKPGMATLSATSAWKIDEQSLRFVEVSTPGLQCPRDGIVTSDGGP